MLHKNRDLLVRQRPMGGITKQGDGYLRRPHVIAATAVMRMTRKTQIGSRVWRSS